MDPRGFEHPARILDILLGLQRDDQPQKEHAQPRPIHTESVGL